MITGSDCLLVAGMRMEIKALSAENAALKRAERRKTTCNRPTTQRPEHHCECGAAECFTVCESCGGYLD